MTRQKGKKNIRHDSLELLNRVLWHRLNVIWEKAEAGILEAQKSPLGHQQGSSHVKTVEENLSVIIPDDYKGTRVSAMDLFLLSAAACLHDTGRASNVVGDHGHRSWEEIRERPQDFGLEPGEAEAVAWLVRVHNDRRVEDLPKLPFAVSGTKEVVLPILAALLCLADTLHCDASRASLQVTRMRGVETEEHPVTRFRRMVRGWVFDDEGRIAIQATAKDLSDVDIYYEGFQLLRKEVEPLATILEAGGYPHELVPCLDDSGLQYKVTQFVSRQRGFPGMDFYHEEDAPIFKGRNRDVQDLYLTIISSPVSLLVGDSGAGKSSLVCAGLFPYLQQLGTWKHLWSRLHEDPIRYVTSDIYDRLLGQTEVYPDSILSAFERISQHVRFHKVLIVLDQFEDILDESLVDRLDKLRQAFVAVLARKFPNLHVLLVYRTEAQARLGPWLQGISGSAFGLPVKYLPLLDDDGAIEAIQSGLSVVQVGCEPADFLRVIVADIRSQVQGQGVWPPFLQMVAESLVVAARESQSAITPELFASMGGACGVIATYLIRRLQELGSERFQAEQVLKALIRSSGKRAEESLEGLHRTTGLEDEVLAQLLHLLIDRRIIRRIGGDRYEIIHDYFAQLVYNELVTVEERRIKQLKELLSSKAAAYPVTGTLLSSSEIAQLYLHREKITPSQPEEALLLHSCIGGFGPAWYWFRNSSREAIIHILRKSLSSPQREVRLGSLTFLASNKLLHENDEGAVRDMLKDSDPNVRKVATEAYGRLVTRDSLTVIRDMLNDANWRVREAAVKALGHVGSRDDLHVIHNVLEDREPDIRKAAVEAFGQLGSVDDLPLLRDMLEDSHWHVREAAITALGRLLTRDTLPTVLDMLKDRDADVREAAVEALCRLATHDDLPVIRDMLKDDHPDVRRAAVKALSQVGSGDDLSLVRDMLKDRHASVFSAALETLSHLGNSDDLVTIRNLLTDADWRLGKATAMALGRLCTPDSLPLIRDMLKDTNWRAREVAVTALGEVGNRDDFSLMQKMLEDCDASVREAAVKALCQLATHDDMPVIRDMLKDDHPDVQRAAVKALGQVGSGDDLSLVRDMLKDDIPSVRIAALEALGQLGGVNELSLVRNMLKYRHPDVREMAVKVLGQLITKDNLIMIRDMLKDREADIRQAAIEALSHLCNGGSDEVSALAEMVVSLSFTDYGLDISRILMRLDLGLYCPLKLIEQVSS